MAQAGVVAPAGYAHEQDRFVSAADLGSIPSGSTTRKMQTVTRLNHQAKTTKGFTLRTPMAIGQVWLYEGQRHVVERVYPRKVRFIRQSKVLMTVDQKLFVKHARLKAD